MKIDTDKIVDAVPGLLWLTLHEDRRAWKGLNWSALDRLHQNGLIAKPTNKAKSALLTDEACGVQRNCFVPRSRNQRGKQNEQA